MAGADEVEHLREGVVGGFPLLRVVSLLSVDNSLGIHRSSRISFILGHLGEDSVVPLLFRLHRRLELLRLSKRRSHLLGFRSRQATGHGVGGVDRCDRCNGWHDNRLLNLPVLSAIPCVLAPVGDEPFLKSQNRVIAAVVDHLLERRTKASPGLLLVLNEVGDLLTRMLALFEDIRGQVCHESASKGDQVVGPVEERSDLIELVQLVEALGGLLATRDDFRYNVVELVESLDKFRELLRDLHNRVVQLLLLSLRVLLDLLIGTLFSVGVGVSVGLAVNIFVHIECTLFGDERLEHLDELRELLVVTAHRPETFGLGPVVVEEDAEQCGYTDFATRALQDGPGTSTSRDCIVRCVGLVALVVHVVVRGRHEALKVTESRLVLLLRPRSSRVPLESVRCTSTTIGPSLDGQHITCCGTAVRGLELSRSCVTDLHDNLRLLLDVVHVLANQASSQFIDSNAESLAEKLRVRLVESGRGLGEHLLPSMLCSGQRRNAGIGLVGALRHESSNFVVRHYLLLENRNLRRQSSCRLMVHGRQTARAGRVIGNSFAVGFRALCT